MVMPQPGSRHRVQQGECIASISAEVGHLPETIWNYSKNSELKNLRDNPYVLFPGDHIEIPELELGSEDVATDARHRFRRKSARIEIRLRILGAPVSSGTEPDDADLHGPDDIDEDEPVEEISEEPQEPRANTPYVADVDGIVLEGDTDDDGCLEISIPADSRQIHLKVGESPDVEELIIDLGAIDPVDETSGVQQRLNNLGYRPGPIDGIIGSKTQAAIRKFQATEGLEENSEIDAVTRDTLVSAHGC